MAFHHRKLLNPSYINPNITESCSESCDPDENSTGICPADCISVCFPVCNTPPPPPTVVITAAPHKTVKLSLYITVPLAVLATAFFIFTCYTAYKLYTCWYNSRRRRRLDRIGPGQEPGPDELLDEDIQGPAVDHHVWYIRTVGLQPSVISKISVVKYKKGDGLIDGTDCSVCLNEFEEDETLRLLPKCNHAFHIPCIDTWLRSHTNCPMCRAGIVMSTIRAVEEETVMDRNSGRVEEAQIEDRGSVNQASELRIGVEEEDNESRAQARLGPKIDDGGVQVQPMRRSISLDSLSATAINSAVANAFPGRDSDNRIVEAKSPLNDVSSGTIGSSSVKRSLSCSAKVFLSRYNSRSRNSEA